MSIDQTTNYYIGPDTPDTSHVQHKWTELPKIFGTLIKVANVTIQIMMDATPTYIIVIVGAFRLM